VVVVRAVREDEVGPERPDQADDLFAAVQTRFQSPIAVVPDVIPQTKDGGGGLRLRPAAGDQGRAGDPMVARLAVGDRDETDIVAELPVEGGQAAGLDLGVVGVCADDQ